MREIVLDTETTGFDPKRGDRIIEIGCVELLNRIPTGREERWFINPERDVPAEAQAVHGITTDFLRDKPLFKDVADAFQAFVGGDTLVIHNAAFDIGFLNFELGRLGRPGLKMDRVVDTLALARRKHPAGPNTLDALCKRYAIDNTKRVKHGALVDCWLLAEVYLELLGERQAALGLQASGRNRSGRAGEAGLSASSKARATPLPSRVTAQAAAAHRAFIDELGAKAIWRKYWGGPGS